MHRPLFWVPLVIDDCFEQTQRPVYSGPGGTAPPTGAVHQAPPYYQDQAPNYQGQGPPPYQGSPPHQGPQAQGPGVSGVVQGGNSNPNPNPEPAIGQPVHPGGPDSGFPDPVKPPKTTA